MTKDNDPQSWLEITNPPKGEEGNQTPPLKTQDVLYQLFQRKCRFVRNPNPNSTATPSTLPPFEIFQPEGNLDPEKPDPQLKLLAGPGHLEMEGGAEEKKKSQRVIMKTPEVRQVLIQVGQMKDEKERAMFLEHVKRKHQKHQKHTHESPASPPITTVSSSSSSYSSSSSSSGSSSSSSSSSSSFPESSSSPSSPLSRLMSKSRKRRKAASPKILVSSSEETELEESPPRKEKRRLKAPAQEGQEGGGTNRNVNGNGNKNGRKRGSKSGKAGKAREKSEKEEELVGDKGAGAKRRKSKQTMSEDTKSEKSDKSDKSDKNETEEPENSPKTQDESQGPREETTSTGSPAKRKRQQRFASSRTFNDEQSAATEALTKLNRTLFAPFRRSPMQKRHPYYNKKWCASITEMCEILEKICDNLNLEMKKIFRDLEPTEEFNDTEGKQESESCVTTSLGVLCQQLRFVRWCMMGGARGKKLKTNQSKSKEQSRNIESVKTWDKEDE